MRIGIVWCFNGGDTMEQFYYFFDGKKWAWAESDGDWVKKDIEEYNIELTTSTMSEENRIIAAEKQSEKCLLAHLDFKYLCAISRYKSNYLYYLDGEDISVVARWRLQLYKKQKVAIILADVFKVEISSCTDEPQYSYCDFKDIQNLLEGQQVEHDYWVHRYGSFKKYHKQYSLRLDYGNWKYTAIPSKCDRCKSNNNWYNYKYDWTEKGFAFSAEIPSVVVARAMEFLKELATEEFGFSPTVPNDMPGNKLLKYFVQYPKDVHVGLYVDMLGYNFGYQVLRNNASNFDLVCDYLKLPKTKSLKKAYHENYAAMAICHFLSRKVGINDINIWQFFLDGKELMGYNMDTFGIDKTGNFYFKYKGRIHFGWWEQWDLLYTWLLEKWGAKRTGEILSDALLQPMDRDKYDCLNLWYRDYQHDDLPEEFVQAIYRYGISKEAHDIRNMLNQQVNERRQKKDQVIKSNIIFNLTPNELDREEETPKGKFKIARTGRELYDISEKMHNCVFSCYTESMQRKDCTIYYLQKDERYLACIEVRHERVVQARGMCNGHLQGDLFETVTSWCARHELTYAVS